MATQSLTGLGFQPMGKQIASKKGIKKVADIDPRLTRSYYFDNRLLTDKDLNRDQLYLDGRLREVGQSLGYGVMRGLDVDFDNANRVINVNPGLAISRAGRVLELSRNLSVDLGDRGTLLKFGNKQRFDSGLYALIIQYTEYGTDVAEVFPTDLASEREFNFDLITEGVKVALVKLSENLSNQNSLQIRANLLSKFYGDSFGGGSIPEDAVALGLLAISNDRPQWFDKELLRQPLRASNQAGDTQRDLYRQYQHLFSDLMTYRRAGSLSGDFAAADYFRLLPPVGALPKESVNPMEGRQNYFPENYTVWVAPIRMSEIALLQKESMLLPPLNLSLKDEQDAQEIIVLAPLSNTDYGHYAQRLQQPMNTQTRKLPSLDLLRLRLYPRRPVHELDTDRTTWEAIWDAVNEGDLLYIRRPQRAAETSLSGIVLAQGVNLPTTPPVSPDPSPADAGLLQDEDSVFLNRINISLLTGLRGDDSVASTDAAAALNTEFAGQAAVAQQLLTLCLRIERQYDALLWQTLLPLARSNQLDDFSTQLITEQDNTIATPTAISNLGAAFGLASELINEWNNLAI